MWSNCWLYARQRQRREGGYVVSHRSVFGWWPHVYWTRDFETFWVFETNVPQLEAFYHWLGRRKLNLLPPLVFPGLGKSYSRRQLCEKWPVTAEEQR